MPRGAGAPAPRREEHPPVARVLSTPIPRWRVTPRGSRPTIRRCLEVPFTQKVPRLHGTLRALMGWLDSHPRVSVEDGVAYGEPELSEA